MIDDTSKLDVSSRDFLSIYEDLISARGNLSQDWNTYDESDPGIVLVKLMAMTGDMLSYNHDRAVLEVYPATVQQRKNASQLFGLLGYKMHWYQSARTTVKVTNNTAVALYIPSMTTFVTTDGSITYTYIGTTVSIPINSVAEIPVIQGIPKTPSLLGTSSFVNPNSNWWSVYDYNVVKSDIVNNKIYLNDKTVDESSIVLVDSDGYVWTQVDRIDAEITADKFFELNIDDNDNPYLELPSYWENFDSVSKFRVFYLVSAGLDGQIRENTLTTIKSTVYASDGSIATVNGVLITNDRSTIGFNYETPAEARDNSAKFINTYDTLITLGDFEKATKRVMGVANCKATDKTNDPHPDQMPNGTIQDMTNTDLKIYVTKQNNVEWADDVFKASILNSLKANKNLLYNISIELDGITEYVWTIKGTIYLKEKVSRIQAQNILVDIRNAIATRYAPEFVNYNELISYFDVLETIKNASGLVYNVDVDGINYYTDATRTTQITDKSEITGKYSSVDTILWDGSGPYTTTQTFVGTPVKPGTFVVNLNNGKAIITDDTAGKLICDNAQFLSGTIDYETATITLVMNTQDWTQMDVNWVVNKITLPKYSFEVNDLVIAEESVII